MRVKATQLILSLEILMLALLLSLPLRAQVAGAVLSGTVTGPAGAVPPHAKISVKKLSTGQSVDAQADATGIYTVPNLAPGDYEVSISADGFDTKINKITLAAGATVTLDAALAASPTQPQTPAATNLPDAPSSAKKEPTLQDLGFPADQTQADAKKQALLDKRTHMLKVHQRLGLITMAPMIATVVASFGAGGKDTSTSSRDLHAALGGLTGDLYFATAYYAIRAPKIEGTKTRGPIRFHKAMIWIHGPGMILTPILGIMAFDEKSKGEKVHGIASAHGPVAIVTAGAFGAALLSVSVKF
ncbi:MAG: carboxypeptidase-like regulatory domain-containing protein [Terriglobales bacterium]